MTRDIFLGRTEEQAQFRRTLRSHLPHWISKHLPTVSKLFIQPSDRHSLPNILLFHGEGGMGKTSLVKQLRRIVETEKEFQNHFKVLFLDWEAKQKLTLDLKVGHDYIRPETILAELHKALDDEGWGSYFEPYRKLIKEIQRIEERVEQALRSQPELNLPKEVSNLGAKGIAWIIRQSTGLSPDAAVIEQTLKVSAESLYQARQFVQKAVSHNQRDFDTYAQPHERLAEALGKGMAELAQAKRQPLVVLLDTYEIVDRPECDYTLRTVVKCGGDRVIWVIAGRANLADSGQRGDAYFRGYKRDFPEDRIYAKAMSEFGLDEIQAYFQQVVGDYPRGGTASHRPITPAQAEALARFSLGVPFVISEAAAMWREGKPIDDIVEPVPMQLGTLSPREQVIKATSERFLMHCFSAKERERDLQAVYALAMMRRPSVELLKAMLDVTDLNRELQALRDRYSFIWVEQVRLDEKLAKFLRDYLLAEVRRTTPMVQQVNDRAIAWLQLCIEDQSREWSDTADRLNQERLAESITDLIYHSFWRSETEGWKYLVPRFIEGWQYNRSWTRSVLDSLAPITPTLGRETQQHLRLMTNALSNSPDLEELRALLTELEKQLPRLGLDSTTTVELNAILLLQRGRLHHLQGKYHEALQTYLTVEPQLPELALTLRKHLADEFDSVGLELGWKPDKSDSIASPNAKLAFERAVTLDPTHASAWYRLGGIQLRLGELESAVNSCRKSLGLNSENSYTYNGLGLVLQKQGQLPEAIAAYHKAIDLNPDDATAYNNLGIALKANQQLNEAIAAYHKAIDLNPDYATAYNNLGNALQANQQLNEAIAAYHKAIELNPDYANAYYNLGNALSDNQQLTEAIEAYKKAIDLNPDYATAYYNLGIALKANQQLPEAIEAYKKAIDLNPNDGDAYDNLGTVLSSQGQLDRALEAHQKALELGTTDKSITYRNYAYVLHQLKEYVQAIAAYHKAIDLNPDYATAYNNLGNALQANQQLPEAIAAYK
ncbi:MAG: tetratricopeptide repeat protein [Oculatellaceae cyanobacterium bins.114]|nr:tetratricopeptide repeat protein [Oculatellaceae cyanobacterium bins.114]